MGGFAKSQPPKLSVWGVFYFLKVCNNNNMRLKQPVKGLDRPWRLLLLTALTGLAILFVLFSTTPSKVGPQGTTGFFVLVYLFVLSLVEWLYQVRFRKKHYWAFWLRAVYALVPVTLLALASLRQLKTTDLVVSLALLLVVTVYHNRTIS